VNDLLEDLFRDPRRDTLLILIVDIGSLREEEKKEGGKVSSDIERSERARDDQISRVPCEEQIEKSISDVDNKDVR